MRQVDEPLLQYHIEHIVAKQHGGPDDSDNLCLSCHYCNLHKGPNLTAIDPETGRIVRLFDPRSQLWNEHFMIRGTMVIGLSECGRATVRLLQINNASRVELRILSGLTSR
jgi:hypothetical protein